MNIEYKSVELNSSSRKSNIINGYASVFNNVDTQNDIILPGAFVSSVIAHLAGKTIPLLWQHKQDVPIGKIESMYEDDVGLYIKGIIAEDISSGKEAMSLVEADIISGLSIGFIPLLWSYDENEVRRLEEIDLLEISLVTFPANELAKII